MPITNASWTSPLLDKLFEEPGAGRCLVAPDGSILRANAEWLRSTGNAPDDVLGADLVALFPETRDMALALHARARAGHRVEVPRHAQRIGGRETWWEGSIDPIPMEGGAGLLVTAREVGGSRRPEEELADAAEQRRAERALRESEEKLRLLADAMPQIVCVLGPDGVASYVNRTWQAYSGLDLVATNRAGWQGLLHPDDLPAAVACRRRALATLLPQDVELRYRAADGAFRWFVSRIAPIAEGGRVVRFVGAAMEIEDRKRVEHALLEQLALKDQLAKVAASVPGVVCSFRLRPDGGASMPFSAPAIEDLYGVSQAALARDMTVAFARMPPEDRARVREAVVASAETMTPWRAEFRYDHPTKGLRWIEGTSIPSREPDGSVLWHGYVVDVTDRKRAADAFAEAHRAAEDERGRLAAVLAALPTGVAITDARGRVTDMNEAFRRLWGGPSSRTQDVGEHREWRGWWPQTGAPIAASEWAMARALATGTPVSGEAVEIERFDGSGRATVIVAAAPIRNGEGELAGGVVAMVDISAQKRAEDALREVDRRKDEFLGMLSHELRNPLAPIRNSVYVLRHAAEGAHTDRALTVIERQTTHLTRLVDDLLDVTRIARGKIQFRRERVDLREVVRRTGEDFRSLLEESGAAYEVHLPEGRVHVDADATRLAQVIGNLLHNAAKFTRRGDAVTLALVVEGELARIEVRDTGAGIDPALLPKVFDAFVQADRTLARSDGGLGLGLALVKGIVALHGGTVRAESAGHGRGTTFTVELPAARAAVEVPSQRGTGPRTALRRVLVVDDNHDAADSLAALVAVIGHEVEVAYDGKDALERARARLPDVILCDLGLPGLDGYAVARELRALAGNAVRLVAVSGYAQPEDVARALAAGFDAHVAKPPDPDRIVAQLG